MHRRGGIYCMNQSHPIILRWRHCCLSHDFSPFILNYPPLNPPDALEGLLKLNGLRGGMTDADTPCNFFPLVYLLDMMCITFISLGSVPPLAWTLWPSVRIICPVVFCCLSESQVKVCLDRESIICQSNFPATKRAWACVPELSFCTHPCILCQVAAQGLRESVAGKHMSWMCETLSWLY